MLGFRYDWLCGWVEPSGVIIYIISGKLYSNNPRTISIDWHVLNQLIDESSYV